MIDIVSEALLMNDILYSLCSNRTKVICLIGRVCVFYVGHVDRVVYMKPFSIDIVSEALLMNDILYSLCSNRTMVCVLLYMLYSF
jgi:hypothetical protein